MEVIQTDMEHFWKVTIWHWLFEEKNWENASMSPF